VRAGDTLSAIAQRYRLKLADLLRWNRLHLGSVIRPGQALMLRGD
jgi:membrane-bound lytic murein transglycosylase D